MSVVPFPTRVAFRPFTDAILDHELAQRQPEMFPVMRLFWDTMG
jgi:hypothetical protein